jgi:hypothetical protein
VVTVPLEWTGVCNISIIIKTCVNCTVLCLLDRVLAPITSTWRPVSLHQLRVTSQVRLLVASIESHVLHSSIMLPPLLTAFRGFWASSRNEKKGNSYPALLPRWQPTPTRQTIAQTAGGVLPATGATAESVRPPSLAAPAYG